MAKKSRAQGVARAAPKKNPSSKKKKSNRLVGETASAYYHALTNPFSPRAAGARVPDQYAVPTATYMAKQTLTLQSDANGNIDVIIFPNLVQMAVSTRGNITGGSTWEPGVTGLSVTNGWKFVNTSSIQSELSSYRIVSYGVRVINMANANTAAGRVYAATVPISSWMAQRTVVIDGVSQVTDSTLTMPNVLKAYGIASSGNYVDINQITQLPGAVVQGVPNLEGCLQIVPKVMDPEAFVFRNTDYNTGIGFGAFRQAAGAIFVSDTSSFRVSGHESVLLAATGLPASSTGLFDVEIIYHLEGNVSATTSSSGVVSSQNNAATSVDVLGMMQSITMAAGAPSISNIVQAGSDIYRVLKSL